MPAALVLRRGRPADSPAILALLAESLAWSSAERDRSLFEWKHQRNPFGASLTWVALAGERVVGFRAFLRWRFVDAAGLVLAVRAVDTATASDYRRQGIFSQLTAMALEELAGEGVGFVFNTPNDASGPGYRKLGWQEVGRLRPRILVRGPLVLGKLAGAKTAAERWPVDTEVGTAAAEFLADAARVEGLLARLPAHAGLQTERTAAYLAWRYGFPALGYRILPVSAHLADGMAVFRLRRRGGAVEAVVCELLVPDRRRAVARGLVREVLRRSGADYALVLGRLAGAIPLPGQGPRLVTRAVGGRAPTHRRQWALTMGDIELQ